jgi:hypothetical protein
MRKFLVAGLLALPVLALTQATASAWCKFNCGLSFSCGGRKCCFENGNPPCDSCCCPAPVYMAAPPAPAHHHAGPSVPVPAPAAPPATPGFVAPAPTPVTPAQAIQAVDYQTLSDYYYWNAAQQNAATYYQYYQAAYGAGQVPSYWYGN